MASATYIVVDARAEPVYDIVMEAEDDGEEFQINSVPEKELQLSVGTLEDEALLEKARGKKVLDSTHPSLLVFQSCVRCILFYRVANCCLHRFTQVLFDFTND